jgi:hypothetical protein
MTGLSVLSREIVRSPPRNDVLVIWVTHCLRLGAGVPIGTLNVGINVCPALILTNEKYYHLISILLI